MRTHNIPSYLRKSKIYSYYASGPGAISSNYPCLEHISMVPKVFEPLKFYCIHIQGNPSAAFSLAAISNGH